MRPAYLLDSVILIDHLRGISSATKWLSNLRDGEAVISVVTRAELLAGGDELMREAATLLCDQFECLPLSRELADLTAELRRTHRWKLPDAFQAALAQHHGLKLVTRNTRDFPAKTHRFVLTPYEL